MLENNGEERGSGTPGGELNATASTNGLVSVTGVATPTVMVYQYGVRLDPGGGFEQLLEQQFGLAHRFYNDLVAMSREVFASAMAVLEQHDPRIKTLREQIDALYEARREARAADDRERFAATTTEISGLRRERMTRAFAARRECTEKLQGVLADVAILRKESRAYGLRTNYVVAGLYWATAGAVMRAFATAWQKQWPRLRELDFRRAAERTRQVVVDQINDCPGGLTQEELFSGSYRRLHIDKSAPKKYLPFSFRAGPHGQQVHGTVLWHRELPPGARVGEARLVQRRIARQKHYYLQLQLSLPQSDTGPAQRHATSRGVAGLALGWYRDGDTRRIGALSESGSHEQVEIIRIPQDILADFEQVEQWTSERDQARDTIVATLKGRMPEGLPDPLAERIADIIRSPANHVSPARLASIVLFWRDAYPQVAGELLAELEGWRKSDAIRWECSSHVRTRALNRRRSFYLDCASRWTKRYHTILLHELDLTRMAAVKDTATGEHNDLGASARAGRYVVALYELETALEKAGAKNGCRIVRVAAGTAQACSVCGEAATELSEKTEAPCVHCGEIIERRANGAANLRRYYDLHADEIDEMGLKADTDHLDTLKRRAEKRGKRTAGRVKAAERRRAENDPTGPQAEDESA